MSEPERSIGVYCLDVGQGDATVVLPPSGEGGPIVFDCRDDVVITKLLTQWKQKEIQALVLSHLDWDHIAGARQLLQSKDVKVHSIFLNIDRDIRSTHDKAKEAKALLDVARQGEKDHKWYLAPTVRDPRRPVAGGADWCVDLLAPPFGKYIDMERDGEWEDPNCLSGVLRVRFGKTVVLVGGDAPLRSWAEMPTENLPARIFRVPHHGGNVDDGETPDGWDVARLYGEVSPSEAVVSVGTQNGYSHPRFECVEPVARGRCRLMCTQVSETCQPGIKEDAEAQLGAVLGHRSLVEPEWRHSTDRRRKRQRHEVPCAGTVAIALYPDKDPRVLPLPDAHSEIVNLWSKSICRPEAV